MDMQGNPAKRLSKPIDWTTCTHKQAQDVPRSHPRAATQLTSFAADGGDSLRANVDHLCRLYRSNPVQIMSAPAFWEVSGIPS
jgi:hypothetical protein